MRWNRGDVVILLMLLGAFGTGILAGFEFRPPAPPATVITQANASAVTTLAPSMLPGEPVSSWAVNRLLTHILDLEARLATSRAAVKVLADELGAKPPVQTTTRIVEGRPVIDRVPRPTISLGDAGETIIRLRPEDLRGHGTTWEAIATAFPVAGICMHGPELQ